MDEHELNAHTSPRNTVGLAHELGEHTDAHALDDNPFSYYHEHREPSSDGDQHEHEHQHQPLPPSDPPPEQHPHPEHTVAVEQNLNQQPSFHLESSPTHTQPANGPPQSPPSLAKLKETAFTLSQIHKESSAKEQNGADKNGKGENGQVLSGKEREQAEYKAELQRQMQQLRSRQKKKGKIFDQPKKKPNLNKTFAALPRRKQGKESQMQFEQMRMLVKMGFEKKKANYEMLREWDRKRAESLALHGRMVEMLQNEVDTRIKSSLQNFEYYQTFFREKAKQEEKYAASPVINTRYALQHNSLSKNVYINCSVILNSLCDENTQRCRKISDFIQLIRNNILRELTENHLNASQRQLLRVREKISTLKSALKRHNAEAEEKTSELAALFGQQASNISNANEQDFYRAQLSFLRKALTQIELQRKLGEYCLQYYHTGVQEELKRSQVIREAMVTYARGLKQAYNVGLQLQSLQIEQLSKYEQIKLIQQFYALQQMFDERSIQLFKIRNGLTPQQDITIEAFSHYIAKFDFLPFDSRILLLKEFTVTHAPKGKPEQPCYLVITVDNFLHLFLSQKTHTCEKPDVTIKISSKCLQLKNNKEMYLDIVKREQRRASMMSYFWDNKVEKVYRIRFAKKDNKEEFMDYISKLMVDQF